MKKTMRTMVTSSRLFLQTKMLMLKTMLKIISKPIKLKLRMRVTIMMTMLIKMNHREILNKWLIITAMMTNSTRRTMTKMERKTIMAKKKLKEI